MFCFHQVLRSVILSNNIVLSVTIHVVTYSDIVWVSFVELACDMYHL